MTPAAAPDPAVPGAAAAPPPRSHLYAPGSDPAVMRKALAAGADVVILDLEDAVAPSARARARLDVQGVLRELAAGTGAGAGPDAPRPEVHVRINRSGDGYDLDDVHAVVAPVLSGLRLPKCESAASVVAVAELLDLLEPALGLPAGTIGLTPTCESALGWTVIDEVLTCSPRIRRYALGAADLVADLGVTDVAAALAPVRAELVLRSRARGVGAPVDSVHTRLDDPDGLAAAARAAAAQGFSGKSVIHPRQLAAVHAAFAPSPDRVAWAERVVAALDAAAADGAGVAVLDGEFLDEAVARRARAVLAARARGGNDG